MRIVSLLLLLVSISAMAEDGKVFVQTDPIGVEVRLITEKDGETVHSDTLEDCRPDHKGNKRTPILVKVPAGHCLLYLFLENYYAGDIDTDVKPDVIKKPDTVVMKKLDFDTDVIFEDGWAVFVDKQPVKDKDKKAAVTPCTLALTIGDHELLLTKTGFKDLIEKIKIAPHLVDGKFVPIELTINGKPTKSSIKQEEKAPKTEDKASSGLLKAEYGKVDISAKVKDYLTKGMKFFPITASNALVGGRDPLPGSGKTLDMTFEKDVQKTVQEGEVAVLPLDLLVKDAGVGQITAAYYGAGFNWVDVSTKIKSMQKVIIANGIAGRDPAPGSTKYLTVLFEDKDNKRFVRVFREGDEAVLK